MLFKASVCTEKKAQSGEDVEFWGAVVVGLFVERNVDLKGMEV